VLSSHALIDDTDRMSRSRGVPTTDRLAEVLARILSGKSRRGVRADVLERRDCRGSSTFPVEIVTCRLSDGTTQRVFCKYEAGRSHDGHGHRGGVGYEAYVYEQVLGQASGSTPAFFGRHRDQRTGDTWLFIEALDSKSIANTHRLDTRAALPATAAWIGRFHAAWARPGRWPSRIKRYDARYVHGFIDRVIAFSKGCRRQYPWLVPVCARADEFVSVLLAAEPTIVHGECYPGNIVYENGRVCPVDWESAAVAAGELDLAALTEGWRPEIVAACEEEYAKARWPAGAPPAFVRTLSAARIYWAFRWLGDRRSRFLHHRKSQGALARLLDEVQRWPQPPDRGSRAVLSSESL